MKFLIFLILISFNVIAQQLDLRTFVDELNSRQSRVEEFQYVKKIANRLGIKHVYMFGGTAAAWGHYVRWDMRRELGIEKLQSERFDYDYTNIFRANQDFDVVVDGTVEQAEALESAVQKHFNYFSGTRPTWEVRLLNEQRADKDPIMGNDFQNQHTDSHSTGLIEMLDCEGFDCVKDVRDIKNPQSAFLMDLFEAKLHYYFSKNHNETKRFKSGMNPSILSVVRYFTKAVQYELEQRPEDVKLLRRMIKEFNPRDKSGWDRYVVRWLEKNAKKLIVNAVDMEFAQKLVEKNGLKAKLIALGNLDNENSMAWWLNKEALKSFPIGEGSGKTAGELFEPSKDGHIIIAHETNSFAAFESITKAHDGSANVLISRTNASGETALHGWGHYTKLGRYGAVGNGLTIRYILNPKSVEGHDFIVAGDFVVVRNRNALKVIYESAGMSTVDYFKSLFLDLEFDYGDQGVLEKLRRRISRKAKSITIEEKSEILKIADMAMMENLNTSVVGGSSDAALNKFRLLFSNLKYLGLQDVFIKKHLKSFLKWMRRYVIEEGFLDRGLSLLKTYGLLDDFYTTKIKKHLIDMYVRKIIIRSNIPSVNINHMDKLQKYGLFRYYLESHENHFKKWSHNHFDGVHFNVDDKFDPEFLDEYKNVVHRWAEWQLEDVSIHDLLNKKINTIGGSTYHPYALKHEISRRISKLNISELKQLEKSIFTQSATNDVREMWIKGLNESILTKQTVVEVLHKSNTSFNFDTISKKENSKKANQFKHKYYLRCAALAICTAGVVTMGILSDDSTVRNVLPFISGFTGLAFIGFTYEDMLRELPRKTKFSDQLGFNKILRSLPKYFNVKLGRVGKGDILENEEKTEMKTVYKLNDFSLIDLQAQINIDGLTFKLIPKKDVFFKIEDFDKELKRFFDLNKCDQEYLSK